jgi:hypothetical protein
MLREREHRSLRILSSVRFFPVSPSKNAASLQKHSQRAFGHSCLKDFVLGNCEYRLCAMATPHANVLESSTAKQVRAHDLHTPLCN